MLPYAMEWVHLLVRWLHLIAGVAWIGASFYFIALDFSLKPPKDARDEADGVGGEAWEIHGGGFYQVKKFKVAPPALPEHLAWFKWEAYTTWLSGFGLLVLLYFLQADRYLIDRSVADISAPVGVAIALAVLGLGWLVYDGLCRVLEKNDGLLALLLAVYVVAVTYGLSLLFSARAVYILVGAMLGTIMAANVFFIIIPGQHDLVAAKQSGREPLAIHGIRGKQRSIHNNYLTLPVLFAMISNHFPMTYGHPQGWLVLIAIMAIAAWTRHFFNLRHLGREDWRIPASAAVATLFLALAIAPPQSAPTGPTVAFAEVQPIVQRRCLECHSQQPSNATFTTAPKNVTFDTPEQIKRYAADIYQQSVATKAMPLGNWTNMTDDERRLLGAWISQGARVE